MNSYSTDQLSKLSTEELQREFLSVRGRINLARKNNKDSVDLEIYYCYITRELDYREKSKKSVQRIKN